MVGIRVMIKRRMNSVDNFHGRNLEVMSLLINHYLLQNVRVLTSASLQYMWSDLRLGFPQGNSQVWAPQIIRIIKPQEKQKDSEKLRRKRLRILKYVHGVTGKKKNLFVPNLNCSHIRSIIHDSHMRI
jgi:hypothetical protein